MRQVLVLGLACVSVALSGANCGLPVGQQPQPEKQRTAGLRGFSSAEELRAYFVEQAQVQSSGTTRDTGTDGIFSLLFGATPLSSAAPEADNSTAGGAGGGGFSTTNIQEAGVDESDIVKNNGQTIYALDGNTIHIVQATPPSGVTELARVNITATGNSLYLKGNRLIALSTEYGWYYGGWGWDMPVAMRTDDGVANVAAAEDSVTGTGSATPSSGSAGQPVPDAPTSSGSSSGNTGSGTAAQPAPDAPPSSTSSSGSTGPATIVTIFDVSDPAHPALTATIRLDGNLSSTRLIDNKLYVVATNWPELPVATTSDTLPTVPLEEWIPNAEVKAGDGSVVSSGDITTWENFFRPIEPDGYEVTLITTIDVDNPTSPLVTTAISADAGTIYASRNSLYITDTQYPKEPNVYRTDTMIHKLNFTADGTEYVASGLVSGRPMNQYSLGENDGYLRVATHVEDYTATTSTETNNVYVLGDSGQELSVVGKVENLAPGEQIYAARFVGDRGFLVTFKRIDPLFVLDLSDPTNPRLGANPLKVPGYSDHIQLLDENHLLTIGKDAEDTGTFAWVQGVQLSIFDVTDVDNPALLHKQIIGTRGTSSEANSNPKAFNYYAPLNALALPIDLWEGAANGPTYGQHTFTGLYVYNVTVQNGFSLLGRISSSDGQQTGGCYLGYYGFTRGVFIDNDVYSVTQNGVKVADIGDVSTLIGQTTFSSAPSPVYDCFSQVTITLPFGGGLE